MESRSVALQQLSFLPGFHLHQLRLKPSAHVQ